MSKHKALNRVAKIEESPTTTTASASDSAAPATTSVEKRAKSGLGLSEVAIHNQGYTLPSSASHSKSKVKSSAVVI